MRSNNLVTSPVGFMFWDKDLQKFATEAEVRDFCKVENDLYGSNEELRLQCLGRFVKLSDTGMVDKLVLLYSMVMEAVQYSQPLIQTS